MKYISVCILLLSLMLFSEPSFAQTGGGYDLTWSTIDGGGGEASGGGFTLNGTLGQADAGMLSGGGFELKGGFWQATSAVPPTAITLNQHALPAANATPFAILGIFSLALAFISYRVANKHT